MSLTLEPPVTGDSRPFPGAMPRAGRYLRQKVRGQRGARWSQVGREHLSLGAQGFGAFRSACAVVVQSDGLAFRHFRTHDLDDVLLGQSAALDLGDADADGRRLD